jgi:DNA-binding HxlR family transcriptional regulator
MMNTTQEAVTHRTSVSRIVEDVVGCKWSLAILRDVRRGVCRPGALERDIPGLTTKVMNERLKKLVGYGVLERLAYPEIPPRVEYKLTPFGEKFVDILDAIERLEAETMNPC